MNRSTIRRGVPRRSQLAAAISALLLGAGLSAPALAEEPAGPGAEERKAKELEALVVTATRRAKSAQEVPLNISAIDGENLRQQGVGSLAELGRVVPGLFVLDQGARASNQIIVRGLNADPVAASEALGNGSGGTVATYIGEIPLYVDLRMEDLERVEVLLGPQGTLYGAGTLGGAIRYIPKRPEMNASTVEVRGSGYGLSKSGGIGVKGGSTLNIPLGETFALRANVNYLDDPGFIDYNFLVRQPGVSDPEPAPGRESDNLRQRKDADDQQTLTTRLGFRWLPVDSVDVNLTHYYQSQEVGARTINHEVAFNTGRYESAHRFLEPNDRENALTALEITADLGFAELTSATGYSTYDERGQRDQTDLLITLEYSYEAFPAFAAFTREDQDERTLNQELRLVSTDEGPLSWILGGFYNELKVDAQSREFTPGYSQYLGGGRPDNLEYFSVNRTDLKEKAIFGELGYEFTDRWQVTVGARFYDYDLDTQDAVDFPLFNSVFGGAGPDEINLDFEQGGQSDSGNLFKFNTSYQFSEAVLGYFTVSEGYRIGNSNGIAPCPDPLPPNQIACALPDELQFFPDKTTNYEMGLRTQLFDRRLTLNGSIYHIDWEDPQLAGTTENAALPITRNGEGAESQGIEVNFNALLTDFLSLRGSFAYTRAELTEDAPGLLNTIAPPGFSPRIDVDGRAGDRLPGSPEKQANLFASYLMELEGDRYLTFNYGVSAIGNILTRTGGRADGEKLPGFAVHNASLVLDGYNWSVTLYAENVLDRFARTGARSSRPYVQTVSDENGDPVTVRRYYHDVLRPREVGLSFVYYFDL
ncbi:TonB-dependent receptor [Pseudomarimonas salicorniae]|uniref:TonB-dependent receptor n=1 Tax=Pseudomarimonas salicorniae TaxID=2933270 RepID=A0ABT0GE98_9GAMM|nr:TonB-dependent receptor [Lysobacter sp. CAU 1642]MCK7592870.1 TonB-dependent receptor [Lysobacter sp. CAU 1642]